MVPDRRIPLLNLINRCENCANCDVQHIGCSTNRDQGQHIDLLLFRPAERSISGRPVIETGRHYHIVADSVIVATKATAPIIKNERPFAMKQPLTAAAITSVMAAPLLATPADAFALTTLLCSAAVGAALIGSALFGDVPEDRGILRALPVTLRSPRKSAALH
jgi:hypothetical protein